MLWFDQGIGMVEMVKFVKESGCSNLLRTES
jgi:hypothetical protein